MCELAAYLLLIVSSHPLLLSSRRVACLLRFALFVSTRLQSTQQRDNYQHITITPSHIQEQTQPQQHTYIHTHIQPCRSYTIGCSTYSSQSHDTHTHRHAEVSTSRRVEIRVTTSTVDEFAYLCRKSMYRFNLFRSLSSSFLV